jgi:hypothetical protein
MLPPSDSLRHQDPTLAGALSNIRAIEVPPLPSYTLLPITANDPFHDYATDADEDEEDCLAPLAPITVHVDASIRIDGQANTVILPPCPTTNSTASGQAGLARTAQAGHARPERFAGTVLTALRDAGVVGDGSGGGGHHPEHRAQGPLEVNVNASLSITGEKNVICAGTLRGGRRRDGNVTASTSANGIQEPEKRLEGKEVLKEGSRKRRAESVSLMMDMEG